MKKQELQNQLEILKTEIAKLDKEGNLTGKDLGALIKKMEHQVENMDDSDHAETLLKSVNHSLETFEVGYPQITSVLSQIANILNSIGI